MDHGIDLDCVSELKRREDARFIDNRPRSLELRRQARRTMPLGVPLSWMAFLFDQPPIFVEAAVGTHFTDVDGHVYLDVSLGITAASTGHTPGPVVRAVTERMAKAIGGTLFGNALSMAAARAALLEVWTEETHLRMQQLARAVANGMESAIRSQGRDWDVYQLGNRAGYRFAAASPRNNREAGEYDLPPVRHFQRVFMANRGIWDFGWWGGPAISAQTTAQDIDKYLGTFVEFIEELLA